MQFFETDEVQSIAEQHQSQILRLEENESVRILKLYKSIRQDLRDRLDVVGKGTFSEQQMRGALLQIEGGIAAMQDRLMGGMSDGADSAAMMGIEHLEKELNKWNKHFTGAVVPINVNAAAVATETKNFLINRYQVSMDNYSSSLRSKMTQLLTESAIQQMNYSDVIANVGRAFLGEEWKLHQIVRTELHNVYGLGKLNGMIDLWDEGNGTIPDLRKTLYHRIDSRTGNDTKRLIQNNPVVKVDEPFVEYSTGKKLTYMAPPNRPNDRAIVIPYREAWGDDVIRSGTGPAQRNMDDARAYARSQQ